MNEKIERIFDGYFNQDVVAFAEALANGYDFSNPRLSFDSDVAIIAVDGDDRIMSVHVWDVEEFEEHYSKCPDYYHIY